MFSLAGSMDHRPSMHRRDGAICVLFAYYSHSISQGLVLAAAVQLQAVIS